jgi:AcrR family transcriptional regulator
VTAGRRRLRDTRPMAPSHPPRPAAVAPGTPRASGTPGRPLRRDAARNRDLVVRASIEVFAEFGALGTVDQVAARAGVGRATVYRSFPTREALVHAVGVAQIGTLREIAEDCRRTADPPEHAIVDYVHRFFAYSRTNRLYLELFRDRIPDEVVAARDATRRVLHDLLDAARAAGLVRADLLDDDFVVLTTGVAVQISLDQADADRRWARAPGLLLMALGVSREIAVRQPCAEILASPDPGA